LARREVSGDVRARLGVVLGRRDTQADIALGQDIAARGAQEELDALVELLEDPRLASSAVKAIYECGYRAPELLVPHFEVFRALLDARHNRLVWGGMIALCCVSAAAPELVQPHTERIQAAYRSGTVITKVTAVRTLSRVAATDPSWAAPLVPFFEEVLETADPKQVLSEAEDILPAVPARDRPGLLAVLVARGDDLLTKNARARLRRLAKRYGEA